ncbi:MAG TPA: hypothetical protein VGM17_00280 [Rhizomicrobium sp.]|jgi:hypothetical protein
MRRPRSISEIAERSAERAQQFDMAFSEFLDAWQTLSIEERRAALAEEPQRLDAIKDAYLAALAEHLALSHRLPVPEWSEQPDRFLSEPFFAGGLESLKAILLVESPLAFRRRLIFISADGLSRPDRTMSAAASPAR